MKILIVGQPRTKSTALKMYLKKIYPILSSIEFKIFEFKKNIGFEKKELIQEVKKRDNIIVTLHSCYIIDYANKEILDLNSLNFEQYDKIYFCNRENSIDAILSNIARQDLYEKTNREHYNENDKVPLINVELSDILNKLREKLVFDIMKKFIESKIQKKYIYEFNYNSFENQFEKIFKVKLKNLKIPIKKIDIDYKKYTINYKQVERWFNKFDDVFKILSINDIADKNSIFWKNFR